MYKNALILFTFCILLLSYFHNRAYCDNRLFLHKSVFLSDRELRVNDILSINGNSEELNTIRNLIIPAEIYTDGYIDRKEIAGLLLNHSKEIFLIYGNSVRIIDPSNDYPDFPKNEYIVRKGDRIYFVVKKNGINIQAQGIVLEDGKIADEIGIKVMNKYGKVQKIVKGRVKSKEIVESLL